MKSEWTCVELRPAGQSCCGREILNSRDTCNPWSDQRLYDFSDVGYLRMKVSCSQLGCLCCCLF